MSYETIKQGFLEKEGESTGGTVVSRWRRRFFVIEVAEGGAARISYRDEQAERLGVAAAGSAVLQGASIENPKTPRRGRFAFRLNLRGQVQKSGLSGSTSDTTKWILAASSPEESLAWIDALKQAGVSTAYFSTDVLKSPGGRLSLMPRRNSDVSAATAPTSERRGSAEDGRTRAISCPPAARDARAPRPRRL